MIANPSIKNQSFINTIPLKKLFFSLLTLFTVLYQVFIINEFGKTSSWGGVVTIELFGIITNNVQFFFIFAFIGNLLILISTFQKFFFVEEDGTNTRKVNERQLHFFGIIFYLIGILGYFNFLVFEAFLLLYLVIMAVIYFNAITLDVSPFFQESFTGFDSSVIMNFTVWHPATRNVITDYFNSGGTVLVIFLIISIFLFFVQLVLIFSTQGKLVSERRTKAFQSFFKKNIKLDTSIQKNKLIILILISGVQYFTYILTFLNPLLIITFVILFFYFPIYKKHVLKIEIFKFKYVTLKIFDFYLLNLLILILYGSLIGLYTNILLPIIFIIAIWISIKILEKTKLNLKSIKSGATAININFNTLTSAIFLTVLILYINAWITSDPAENIFLLLFLWTLLIRYSPFLLRNFFNAGVIKFSLRRFAIIIPMFIGISIIVYGLMSIVGNPVDVLLQGLRCPDNDPTCAQQAKIVLEERFGFNNPIHLQWGHWIFRFLLGDFGQELIIGAKPVTSTLVSKIMPTIEISFIPLTFSVLISIPLGIIASKSQNSITDNSILIFVAIGIAVPIFFFLIIMIMFFSGFLKILPSFGRRLLADTGDINLAYGKWYNDGFPINFNLEFGGTQIFNFSMDPVVFNQFIAWDKYDWLFHVFIPILAITILGLALFTRLVRGGMLEIMRNDYILSARASGFSEKVIVNKFALRNVLIPVITILGLSVGSVLGGAPITETVTGWPGLGKYALRGLLQSDYSVIMATYMVVSFMTLTANLLTDIMYSVIDPRVRID